jgi:hypothetical protein
LGNNTGLYLQIATINDTFILLITITENRLDGAILYGNLHGARKIYGAIEARRDVVSAKKVIEEEGFDLSTLKD